MFHFKSKSARQEIEVLFHEIQINLENNYKDLAIDARKKSEKKLEEFRQSGELKEKEYKKLKEELDDFTSKMVGYHH